MNAAVVPVKPLAAGKSRLSERLPRGQLEALSIAMLEDVLAALLATPALDRVCVATPDPAVAEAAKAAGAEALLGPDPGLNAAIDGAARGLGLAAGDALLVVLGDVAGASADELESLFAALGELGGRGVVLAPSSDGGTSALLRAPHDAIPARFGPDSAAAHRRAASSAAVPCKELALPSLALDLDSPDDIERFLASSGGGAHTRALLERTNGGAAA